MEEPRPRFRQCPLWVISGHSGRSPLCPLYPQKRTFVAAHWRWPPRHRNNAASSAYNDLRPPVWPGSARGPFSPLWLPRPCSQKTRASVLLAPTYRHNKFPTARAFGESLAASRQTNSPLGQILHSCRLSTTAGAEPRCTNLLTAKAPTERRGQVSFPEFRKVQPFYRPR
jgi:hypothetical protein